MGDARHCSGPPISEMTYTVTSGTLNSTILYYSECPPIYATCMTILGGTTEQYVIIAGFLAHHWLYEWFSRVKQPNNIL